MRARECSRANRRTRAHRISILIIHPHHSFSARTRAHAPTRVREDIGPPDRRHLAVARLADCLPRDPAVREQVDECALVVRAGPAPFHLPARICAFDRTARGGRRKARFRRLPVARR